jgi:pimeloyl-ACP methyl ester carboxylesterase
MAARMQRTPVPIPSLPIAPLETAFVGPSKQQQAQLQALSSAPPVVLLHGFDSSCLEFRRIYPLLEARTETWAVDLVSPVLGVGVSKVDRRHTQQPDLYIKPLHCTCKLRGVRGFFCGM